MAVPFADLHLQYQSIKPEIDAAIAAVIRDSAFIRGPHVDAFEKAFAEAVDAPHCVSCANGTDALYVAMAALGVKPGDEVITTAHSWISTSAMITHAGANVVFCDTDVDTFAIDPAAIEDAITPRTVGIVPVHLYGQPADMGAIMAIAQARPLGDRGLRAGASGALQGHRSAPSGTPPPIRSIRRDLGAMGDAGAIVTGHADLAERMARLARHGGLIKHQHQIEGINSRLDGLQAAILSAKLPHLARWTAARQAAAAVYDAALNQIEDLAVPMTAVGRTHVYHLYTIQHPAATLAAHLAANGVQTAINYPVALPFLEAYRRLNHRAEQFPNAHRHQERILSLPMFAEITASQQQVVIDLIVAFR